jgi:hypothetical protein
MSQLERLGGGLEPQNEMLPFAMSMSRRSRVTGNRWQVPIFDLAIFPSYHVLETAWPG